MNLRPLILLCPVLALALFPRDCRSEEPAPFDEAALTKGLEPGNGWTGVTPGDGSGLPSVARWNVVPNQDVTKTRRFGIVAFHQSGIHHVEASLEDGPWVDVTRMIMNDQTKTPEYWFTIDPARIPGSGPVEIRARVVPNDGTTVVLPLVVFIDNGGLPRNEAWVDAVAGVDSAATSGDHKEPFRTIAYAIGRVGAGGTVKLLPGTHRWHGWSGLTEASRWVTVEPAGSGAVVSGSPGDHLDVARVRIKDLLVKNVIIDSALKNDWLWLDGCEFTWSDSWYPSDPGPFYGQNWTPGGVYAIDCHFHDMPNGPNGVALALNCTQQNMGHDLFSHAGLVVNCTSENPNTADNPAGPYLLHSDYYQVEFGGPGDINFRNIIHFNVRATGMRNVAALFLNANNGNGTLQDVAFVNCLWEQVKPGPSRVSEVTCKLDNVMFWNCTLIGQAFTWYDRERSDVSVKGCVFHYLNKQQNAGDFAGVTFEDNHYVDLSGINLAPGTRVTTGNPGLDPATFRPVDGSPLIGRFERLVKFDLNGKKRPDLSSVGALEP